MMYNQVNVKRKRNGIIGGIFRMFTIMGGLMMTVIGCVIMATIIGILPGFGLAAGGLLIAKAASTNRQTVKCPNCKQKNAVQKDVGMFACKKCKCTSVISWTK